MNDPTRTDFLLHNIKPENYENLIFAIVLDFTKPWEFLDELSKWADVIFEINKKLFLQLPVSKQNQLRKRIEDHFRFYKNPDKKDEIKENTDENNEGVQNEDEMREALKGIDLDEGVLNVNLGIPVMIILNKSEVVAAGDMMKYFQTRLEFIMKHVREFALRYGASIIFTSTKKGTNMEELYTYMLHRYFDLNTVSPELTNKESILIPTGYDSPKLVQQLCPNIDDAYDKIAINTRGTREMAEEDEIISIEFEKILESVSEYQKDKVTDEESDTAVKDALKKKKIDTTSFFTSLKEGGLKKKLDAAKDGTRDSKKGVEEFKKLLLQKK